MRIFNFFLFFSDYNYNYANIFNKKFMKKIYLIDGNSFIYRMFFALPEFSSSEWVVVNAVFWMAKFFVGQIVKEKPDYVVFIKDAKWDNFRHQIYKEYKATRERMPDNLRSQIPLIEELVQKMGFPIVEIANCEADDVIATLATQLGTDNENDIFILSWDKDLFSLTTQNVKIYDTMKNKIYDDVGACEKFEVRAPYIIDYLAIVWDTADNIPWVAWFGPKKAVELINTYGTVEEIYNHIEDENFVLKWKTLEKLKEGKENAFLSKILATLKKDVEIPDFSLEKFKFLPKQLENIEVKDFFKRYEFFSLLPKEDQKTLTTWKDIWKTVTIIDNDDDLKELFSRIEKLSQIVLDTETTSLDITQAQIVWVSILLDENTIFYMNHLHDGKKVSSEALQTFLKNILALDILLIGHNIKYDLEVIHLFLQKLPQKNQESSVWQTSLFE